MVTNLPHIKRENFRSVFFTVYTLPISQFRVLYNPAFTQW